MRCERKVKEGRGRRRQHFLLWNSQAAMGGVIITSTPTMITVYERKIEKERERDSVCG